MRWGGVQIEDQMILTRKLYRSPVDMIFQAYINVSNASCFDKPTEPPEPGFPPRG